MAAMMVGTTAFAESLAITDIDVVYTGLNTVEVSVPIQGDDQATILSVVNSQDLATVGENANSKIVYINQDGKATGQANLRIAGSDGEVVFPFCTERAGVTEEADGDSGKIDIYAAGSTYEVNAAALSIYKNAPAKSFAFTDATGITLQANPTDEQLKAAFAGKNVTVTHATSGEDVTSTTSGANAGMSYALNENTVTVTFDPALATNAKYDSVDGNPLTTTVPVTVEEEPAVAQSVELVANTVELPKGFTGVPTQTQLEENGLVVKLKYTYDKGTPNTKEVKLEPTQYTATAAADGEGYVVTIHCTLTSFENNVAAPADITTTATVRTTDMVTITGTVKAADALGDTPYEAQNALVAVYDNTTDNMTLVTTAVTDANGVFRAEVAPGKDYQVVVSLLMLELDEGEVVWAGNYGAKAVAVPQGTTNIAEPIVLYQMIGDANGDGSVSMADISAVGTGAKALGRGNYFEK